MKAMSIPAVGTFSLISLGLSTVPGHSLTCGTGQPFAQIQGHRIATVSQQTGLFINHDPVAITPWRVASPSRPA
jgi:hypothetical protein